MLRLASVTSAIRLFRFACAPDCRPIVRTSIPATLTPNALSADVHDRMPVVFADEAYDLWFDPGFQKTDAVCDLLKPFSPALMRRYEVRSRVMRLGAAAYERLARRLPDQQTRDEESQYNHDAPPQNIVRRFAGSSPASNSPPLTIGQV
jgi:hypothetical protein